MFGTDRAPSVWNRHLLAVMVCQKCTKVRSFLTQLQCTWVLMYGCRNCPRLQRQTRLQRARAAHARLARTSWPGKSSRYAQSLSPIWFQCLTLGKAVRTQVQGLQADGDSERREILSWCAHAPSLAIIWLYVAHPHTCRLCVQERSMRDMRQDDIRHVHVHHVGQMMSAHRRSSIPDHCCLVFVYMYVNDACPVSLSCCGV